MRKNFFAITLLILILHSMGVSGKVRCTPIYLFGTSASFNDSIVYFTDIQILDSAWIDEKTEFLINRNEYSNQLREHFNATGHPNRTCLISFATSEKEILKKYAKMQKQFKGNESEIVTKNSKKSAKRTEKSKAKKAKGKLNESRQPAESTPSPSMPPRR